MGRNCRRGEVIRVVGGRWARLCRRVVHLRTVGCSVGDPQRIVEVCERQTFIVP